MQVLISGGSGFLGRALTDALLATHPIGRVIEVTWLSRRKIHPNTQQVRILTYDELAAADANLHFDVVINLAGESVVGQRWSEKRKQLLFDSRLTPTQALLTWMNKVENKPRVFLSSSAIGWYGAQGNTPLDEFSQPQDEFQHQLCAAWEVLALKAEDIGIRTVVLRTGVVLHPSGGMLGKLLTPFKFGLGGHIGSGKQQLSWISRADWVRATLFLLENSSTQGIYNLTAPEPVTNAEFTKALARQLKRPARFPVPAFILKLALGEMSTMLLDGQKVFPKRLQNSGFEFESTTLSQALKASLH